MDASLIPQSNNGIMVEEDYLGLMSSSSSLLDSSSNSACSSSSDFMDDATSSASSSSLTPSEDQGNKEGPLYEMSSLMAELPFKRGLSKFYQGKSQSYACLSNVRCLEDLAKPERPYRKKLKPSMSYGGGLDSQRTPSPMGCSRIITKKASRCSFSSFSAKRSSSFLGSKPPIPPQRSSF